jgi:hypothetical protein
MRLKASIQNRTKFVHFMIYETDDSGVYLFLATENRDEGYDSWYLTVDEAKLSALDQYEIPLDLWEQIPDPLPGALHDIEEPTVAVRDGNGNVTLIAYAEALAKGLVRLEKPTYQPVDNPELIAKVMQLLAQNKQIDAMKVYLNEVGCDLITAKNVIESLYKNNFKQ